MKLQIAIDMVSAQKALAMADEIHDVIDVIEVGTPMIVREGMAAVRMIKQKYPQATVLADVKIVDGGEFESADAFEAGADIVTVLALAADETIKAVVATAKKFNRKAMADMISVTDVEKRAAELDELGLDYICVHTAVDVQSTGKSPYDELARVKPILKHAKAAVAGGVKLAAIPTLQTMNPDLVIAGGALTSRADLREAVVEMQQAIRKNTEGSAK